MPPVNVNPMAWSWLLGRPRRPQETSKRNDVVVWPRGALGSGSGHVCCVAEVRKRGSRIKVRNVGGNQSHPSGGAITLTDWIDIKRALPNCVRRPVPSGPNYFPRKRVLFSDACLFQLATKGPLARKRFCDASSQFPLVRTLIRQLSEGAVGVCDATV